MPITDYTTGSIDGSGFNINIVFEGVNWTDAAQQAFIDAGDFLSTLITGDLADVTQDFGDGQGVRTIDDLEITASMPAIDGVGGVLGQAGPTLIRAADSLPVQGIMQFDEADVQNLLSNGLFDETVLHEMFHVLGFGTLWETLGLVTDIDPTEGVNYRFTGANAQYEYEQLYPTEFAADADAASGVAVESDQGGAGTVGGHWDETTFTSELMTGFLDPDASLSNLSIAALEDMGYQTTYLRTAPICFTTGCMIRCPEGDRKVEDLKIGDYVETYDRGAQPIRYIHKATHLATGASAPVCFDEGAIGNTRRFKVSQMHRFLTNSLNKPIYGGFRPPRDHLIHAHLLVNNRDIYIDYSSPTVTYFHIMFEEHELLFADGLVSESWHPHPRNLRRFDQETREEILSFFPEIIENFKQGRGRMNRPQLVFKVQIEPLGHGESAKVTI